MQTPPLNSTGGGTTDTLGIQIQTALVATIESLAPTIEVGTLPPAFIIRFRDRAGNPQPFSGTVSFGRRGLPTFTAALTPTPQPGVYAATVQAQTVVGTYSATMYNTLTQQSVEVTNPQMTFTPAAAQSARLEEFRPSRAPQYLDILPGYIQNDTLPTFILKCYDRFGNLTDYPGSVALTSDLAASPTTIPVPMRRLTRGLYESDPLILTQPGNFVLTASGFNAVESGTNRVLAGLAVIPIIPEGDDIVSGGQPAAPPQLLCVNPMILPQRPQSTGGNDPLSSIDDVGRFNSLGYTMIWSDEFNNDRSTVPDPTKWHINDGINDQGEAGVGSRTYYTKNNINVQGGRLRITAKNETMLVVVGKDNNDKDIIREYPITSGRMDTRFKSDWRYGIYVVKMKTPNFRGMWAAAWLSTSEIGAPSQEIDFPEVVVSAYPFPTIGFPPFVYPVNADNAHLTVHFPSDKPGVYSEANAPFYTGTQKRATHGFPLFTGGSTVDREYIVLWEKDHVAIWVNNDPNNDPGGSNFIIQHPPDLYVTKDDWVARNGWFLNHFPMHFILNMPAGGDWPEALNGKKLGRPTEKTDGVANIYNDLFEPKIMEVDYVRVYQKAGALKDGTMYVADKPFIVSGTGFTKESQIVLYKDNASGESRKIRTQYWNSSMLLGLVETTDELKFVQDAGASLIVRVSNNNVLSQPKRMWLGSTETEQAKVRPNRFSYARQAFSSPQNNYLTFKKEDGSNIYGWRTFGGINTERLIVDLFSYPAQGGLLQNSITPPLINLRLWDDDKPTRAKWEVQFLPRGTLDYESNWQNQTRYPVFPTSPTAAISTWKAHDASVEFQSTARGVFLGDPNRPGNQSFDQFVRYLGGYPGCYDLLQVRSTIATPNDANSFDDVNICGPFDLRWKISIPSAILNTYTSVTPLSGGLTRITASADAPTQYFTEPSSTNTGHTWEYRIGTADLETNIISWTAPTLLTAIIGASGTTTIPTPVYGQIIEIRDNMAIQVPRTIQHNIPNTSGNNVLTQAGCTTFVATGVSPQYISIAALAFSPNPSSQQAAVGTSSLRVQTAPNPANEALTLSYNLEESATITVEILDVLQRVVATPLTDHAQDAGSYALVIPTAHLNAGAYSLRTTTRTASGQLLRAVQPLLIAH